MPNYAKAIPPEKLPAEEMRGLYSKIAEFLPFYLNYEKTAPAITSGDFSNLSVLDVLDVIPGGKLGAAAAKMAPALGMVINPKTVDKFIAASKAAAERLKSSELLKFDPSIPDEVKQQFIEAVGRVATRYPKVFDKLAGIEFKIPNTLIDTYYGTVTPSRKIIVNARAPKLNVDKVLSHELTHIGQMAYNSPVYSLLNYNNLGLVRSGEKFNKYLFQPIEYEAFRRENEYSRLIGAIKNEPNIENLRNKIGDVLKTNITRRKELMTRSDVLPYKIYSEAVKKANFNNKTLRKISIYDVNRVDPAIPFNLADRVKSTKDLAEKEKIFNTAVDELANRLKSRYDYAVTMLKQRERPGWKKLLYGLLGLD